MMVLYAVAEPDTIRVIRVFRVVRGMVFLASNRFPRITRNTRNTRMTLIVDCESGFWRADVAGYKRGCIRVHPRGFRVIRGKAVRAQR